MFLPNCNEWIFTMKSAIKVKNNNIKVLLPCETITQVAYVLLFRGLQVHSLRQWIDLVNNIFKSISLCNYNFIFPLLSVKSSELVSLNPLTHFRIESTKKSKIEEYYVIYNPHQCNIYWKIVRIYSVKFNPKEYLFEWIS